MFFHKENIVRLLTEVRRRTESADLDARSKEITVDALNFGKAKPMVLEFGLQEQKMVSPNAVGFQFEVTYHCSGRSVQQAC